MRKPQTSHASLAGTSKPTIMVIDDNAENLRVLNEMLSSCGYQVRCALQGSLALSSLAEQLPDLILLDIDLPDIHGFDLAQQIQKTYGPAIPIIFLSNHRDSETKIRAFREGGVDYITKPFHLEELEARLRNHLRIVENERVIQAQQLALQEQNNLLEQANAELEKQLKKVQKASALGVMTAGIAHDFNNIISIISGNAAILKDRATSNDLTADHDKQIHAIENASERAADLIKQLLAFSRMDNSNLIRLRPCLVVREAIKLLHPTLPSHITLQADTTNQQDTIMGDITQLHQVIINVVQNACHAIAEQPGCIEIRITDIKPSQQSPYVELSITDNGPGIARENLPYIFNPFYTTKDDSKGTGLGLAVVKTVVENHAGQIEVDSTLGVGTQIIVRFPSVVEGDSLSPNT